MHQSRIPAREGTEPDRSNQSILQFSTSLLPHSARLVPTLPVRWETGEVRRDPRNVPATVGAHLEQEAPVNCVPLARVKTELGVHPADSAGREFGTSLKLRRSDEVHFDAIRSAEESKTLPEFWSPARGTSCGHICVLRRSTHRTIRGYGRRCSGGLPVMPKQQVQCL
jgi:hypothetical protein